MWLNGIDWNATGSWMQAWAGFLNAAVIAAVAYYGTSQFGDWLRQKQTERQIDVAEKLMSAFFESVEVFRDVRSPMSSAGEVEDVTKFLAENHPDYSDASDEKKQRLRTAQTAISRMARHSDYWTKVSTLIPSARMFFGSGMEKALKEILKQRQRIWASAVVFGDITYQESKDLYQRCQADFWWGYGEAYKFENDITVQVDKIVAQAESVLLPLLQPPPIRRRRKVFGGKDN